MTEHVGKTWENHKIQTALEHNGSDQICEITMYILGDKLNFMV